MNYSREELRRKTIEANAQESWEAFLVMKERNKKLHGSNDFQILLRKTFRYDKRWGSLIKRSTRKKAGSCNVKKNNYSHMRVEFQGKTYPLAKLIWEYHNDPLPEGATMTYRDKNSKNTRIENLEIKMKTQVSVFDFTQQRLRELFEYDKQHGGLFLRSHQRKIGRVRVGSSGTKFVIFKCNKKEYMVSRMVYVWHFGYISKETILHVKNHNPLDLRIENLEPMGFAPHMRIHSKIMWNNKKKEALR